MSRDRFLEAMCLQKVNFAERLTKNLDKNVTYRRKFNLGVLHETTNDDLDADSSLEARPKPGKRRRIFEDSEPLDELPGPVVDSGGSNFKVGTSRAPSIKSKVGNVTPGRNKPCPLSKKKYFEPDEIDNNTPTKCKPCPLSKKKIFDPDETEKDTPRRCKPCPLSKKKFFMQDDTDDDASKGNGSINEKVRDSVKKFKAETDTKISNTKDGDSTDSDLQTRHSSDRTIIGNDSIRNISDNTIKSKANASMSVSRDLRSSASSDSKVIDISTASSNLKKTKPTKPRPDTGASKGTTVENVGKGLDITKNPSPQKAQAATERESIANKICVPQALKESPPKRSKPSPRKKSRIIRTKPDKTNFYDSDDSENDTLMSVAQSYKSINASLRNASLLSNGLTKTVNREQINNVQKDLDKENLDATNARGKIEEKLRQMFSQIADWSDEQINEKCIKKVISKMTPDMKKNLLSIKNLRLNETFVEKAKESIAALKEINARNQATGKTTDETPNTQREASDDLRQSQQSKRSKFNTMLEKSKTFEEFKRNTNIEEFMYNDIMRRYPSTSDTMLPKIDRFMKKFYQKHFLRGEMPTELTLKENADEACRRSKEDSDSMESSASVIPNSREVQIASDTSNSVQSRISTPISMTQIYYASQGADKTDQSAHEKQQRSRHNILFEKSKTFEDFRRNTNIEEFMRNDIIKRHPATFDLMLPKIEKFIKNFYEKHFLKGQIPAQLTLKCADNSSNEFVKETGKNTEDHSLQYTYGGSQNSFQNETLNKVFVECNATISQAYAEQILLQNDQSVDLFPSSGSSVSKSGNKKPSNESIPKSSKPEVDPLCISDIVPVALNECMFPILHLLSPENIECRDSNSAEIAFQNASKIVKVGSTMSDFSIKDKSLNLRISQSQNFNSPKPDKDRNQTSANNSQNSLLSTPAKSSQSSNTFLRGLESPGLINCSILDEIDLDEPTPIKEELQFSRYSDEVEFVPTTQPSVIQIEDDVHNTSNLLDEMMMACPIDNDSNILRLNAVVGPQTSSLSFDPKSMPQSTQLPYTELDFAPRKNTESSKDRDSQMSSTEPFEGIRNSEDDLPPTVEFRLSQAFGDGSQRNTNDRAVITTQTSTTEMIKETVEPSLIDEKSGENIDNAEKLTELANHNTKEHLEDATASQSSSAKTSTADQSPPTRKENNDNAEKLMELANYNAKEPPEDAAASQSSSAKTSNTDQSPPIRRENSDNAEKQTKLTNYNAKVPLEDAAASLSLSAKTPIKDQSPPIPSNDVESERVSRIPQPLKKKKTKQKVKPSLSKVPKKSKKNVTDSSTSVAAEDDIVTQVKHTFQPLEIEFHRNAFVARKRKRKEPFFVDPTNIIRYKIQKSVARNEDDTDFFIEDVTQEIEQNEIESHVLTTDLLNVDSSYFRSSQLLPNHYLQQTERNAEEIVDKPTISAKNQGTKSPQNSVTSSSDAKDVGTTSMPDDQLHVAANVCEIVIGSESIEPNCTKKSQEKPPSLDAQNVEGIESLQADYNKENHQTPVCEIVNGSESIEPNTTEKSQEKLSSLDAQNVEDTESLQADCRMENHQTPAIERQVEGGKTAVVNIIDQIIIVPGKKNDSKEANQREKDKQNEQNDAENTGHEISDWQSTEKLPELRKNAENITTHEGKSRRPNDAIDFAGTNSSKPSCLPETLNEATSKCIPVQIHKTLLNEETVRSNCTDLSKACVDILKHFASQTRMNVTPVRSNDTLASNEKQQVTSSTDDRYDSKRTKFLEKSCVENSANEVTIDSTSVETTTGLLKRRKRKLSTADISSTDCSKSVRLHEIERNIKENNANEAMVDSTIVSSGGKHQVSSCTEDASSLKEISLSCLSEAELTIIENFLDEILTDSPAAEAESDLVNDKQLPVKKDAKGINTDENNPECLQEAQTNVNEGANELGTLQVHNSLTNDEDRNCVIGSDNPSNCEEIKENTSSSPSQPKGSFTQPNEIAIRVPDNVTPNIIASEFSLGMHLDELSEKNGAAETSEKPQRVSDQMVDSVHLITSQTNSGTESVEKSTIVASNDSLALSVPCPKIQGKAVAIEQGIPFTLGCEPNEKTLEPSSKMNSVLETAFCIEEEQGIPFTLGCEPNEKTLEPSSKMNSVLETAFCIEEASMNSPSSNTNLQENKTKILDKEDSTVDTTSKEAAEKSKNTENFVGPAASNSEVSSILNIRTLETIEEHENETEPANAICTATAEPANANCTSTAEPVNANCTSTAAASHETPVKASNSTHLLDGYKFAPKKSLVPQNEVATFEQLTLDNVLLTDRHTRVHRPLKNFYYGHITYLSLYKIKLSAKVNRLRYESSVPFLQPFEKNPIQAVIDFRSGPYKKLHFCGQSLRLLLGLTAQEWVSVFKILRTIETFEYSVFDKDPVDRSIFHRILYYLFKTLPKFSQVTFEYDISNINYATSCLEKRQYKTPFKCLSQAFDSDILQAMARAKRDL